MTTAIRVDPRIRAYGKARIDVTRRARDEREWQEQWHEPRYPFPFTWEGGWKHCIQYTVDDFAAEIGFYIDVLGFPISAFSPSYAQFTSPDQAFFFAVAAIQGGGQGTPVESLRMQFRLEDLPAAIDELERRGVIFERKPESGETSPAIALLRSPNGMAIELWGMLQDQPADPPLTTDDQVESADFWAADEDEEGTEGEQDADDAIGDQVVHTTDENSEEDELQNEPVYVDEDGATQQESLDPVAADPADGSLRPNPAIPRAIIRRKGDILKGSIQFPVRKVRGNGLSNQGMLDGYGDPGK